MAESNSAVCDYSLNVCEKTLPMPSLDKLIAEVVPGIDKWTAYLKALEEMEAECRASLPVGGPFSSWMEWRETMVELLPACRRSLGAAVGRRRRHEASVGAWRRRREEEARARRVPPVPEVITDWNILRDLPDMKMAIWKRMTVRGLPSVLRNDVHYSFNRIIRRIEHGTQKLTRDIWKAMMVIEKATRVKKERDAIFLITSAFTDLKEAVEKER